MKKKTALAAAMLPNLRALFLDEPFEGIDPVTSEAIRVQLRAVAQRGITVLLTSHILSMVDRIADQIVMIRQGRIDCFVCTFAVLFELQRQNAPVAAWDVDRYAPSPGQVYWTHREICSSL